MDRITAYELKGTAERCSVCGNLESKRVYYVLVGINQMRFCTSCRGWFDAADNELTAEDQALDFLKRQNEQLEREQEHEENERAERYRIPAGTRWGEPAKHLTFPRARS